MRITMWHRALVTALALTYLICVLSLSGVQKEDLDVNTLKKLKQHNVNLDDLNNDTLRRDCLSNSNVELSSNKQAASAELVTPTWYPAMTESILRNSRESQATEVPDIDKMIKYFKTPPIQPARRIETEISDTVLKDVQKYGGENSLTTIAHTTTTIRNVADNNSLLNPETLMKFWSMYANFQQSQNQINRINVPTTTTPKVEQRTEKNNVFHITINKYTRNESFLEQYFDNHRNKNATLKRDLSSNHIMEKIRDFISKKLFANEDELFKVAFNLNQHETMQENRIHKSQEHKVDKTISGNLRTFDKDHENTKTVLSKIPPQTLEDIAKEVQDLVLRGLIKTTPKPRVINPKVNPDVTNDISENESDKIPTVLLRSVVNDVKKMLLSELWKDATFKGTAISSTAKAVTVEEILNTPKNPNSADPELNNFIKLFKKSKSWKETSSSSSRENYDSALSNNHLKSSEATYQSYGAKVRKNKAKLKTIQQSSQINDSSTNSDPINPYGYRKYHEKNVITENEEQLLEPDSIPVQFPLAYKTISSEKKKPTKPDIIADSSIKKTNFNKPLARHENRRFKNKHERNKLKHHVQKKLNLNEDLNSNSIEIKYPIKNKDTENQVEGSSKRNINFKGSIYSKLASEYSSNNENKESNDEEATSTENSDNFDVEPALNAVTNQNKDRRTITKLKQLHANRPDHKMALTFDGNSNLNADNPYETSNHPGQNIITDEKAANSFPPNNNFGFLGDGKTVGLGSGYNNAYEAQNYVKNSNIQEQIRRNYNIAPVYNQNAEAKFKSNQELLRNSPNLAYNLYGIPNYSIQNKIQESKAGNNANENQMPPYPYNDPNYSINNKPGGSQHQSDIPNANTGAAFNPYSAPNYSLINNIGNLQEQLRGAEMNDPSIIGYPGAPNYSRKNNIGESQALIQAGATSENNPISNRHQDALGALNYSAQNKIGSIQEPSGNTLNPNSMATYPYAAGQYSAKNKPGEKSDPKISMNIPNPPATYPYNAPSYSTVNKIGDTQAQIPAGQLKNDNGNSGLASPFGGIFGAKVKFPVIQDPRVEALMKDPNLLNPGPSFNSYPSQTYPKDQITNGQGSMTALQNPYVRESQDIISPGLVPKTLNDANVQSGPLNVQSNTYVNPPLPYRERQDIIAPSMVGNSMTDVNFPKPNNVQKETPTVQTSSYTNGPPVVPSAYANQPIDVPASPPNDGNLSKQKLVQSEPIHPPPTKNENTFNTIAKIYPHHSMPNKEKDNADQTPPIMIQTNDDEIMPLGIPIHIKGESKFHMRLIQNQHIIVTTTARPRSRSQNWNDYRLSKGARGNQLKKQPKYSQSSTSYHMERVRPPMTHHDFEDITPNREPSHPSNYYRYEANDMGPRSEQEFESRYLHQYAPEAMADNGPHYNPEMQEDRYSRHRYEKPEKVSLFRNQEKMHDSINAGHLTIAQRHQIPLKRPQVNFDDTHFQNFLKTQEKVNEMLERILATRPKNLSLEPFKGDR